MILRINGHDVGAEAMEYDEMISIFQQSKTQIELTVVDAACFPGSCRFIVPSGIHGNGLGLTAVTPPDSIASFTVSFALYAVTARLLHPQLQFCSSTALILFQSGYSQRPLET